jgi:hypothetical protein
MNNEDSFAGAINMTEQWTRWEPAQGLASNYYIDGILSKTDRIIYTNPIPVQDFTDKPEYMHKILSGALLKEESWNSFVILLSETNNRQKQIRMTFDGQCAYRITSEKYRPCLMKELEKKYGTSFHEWTFFKVEHSSYFTWLQDQSCEIIGTNSIHFSFVAHNLTLDLFTGSEPTIEFI